MPIEKIKIHINNFAYVLIYQILGMNLKLIQLVGIICGINWFYDEGLVAVDGRVPRELVKKSHS